MKEFLRLLRPLRRKMTAERFLRCVVYCETAAVTVCAAVVLVSKFQPWSGVWIFCIVSLLLGLAAAAIWTLLLKKVSDKEIAEAADALGGAQRMITTMELLRRQQKNAVEALAVADGMEQAKTVNFAKQYSVSLPKRWCRCFLLAVVLFLAAGFVPVQRESEAAVFADAQLEKIERVKKEVAQTEEMTKEEKKLFAETVKTLEQRLKTAQTKKEAEDVVRQAQQEMMQLEKESVSEDLRRLAEALQEGSGMESLAQALEKGDGQTMERAIAKMQEMLSQMTAQEQAALAAQLAAAAAQMNDAQLRQALEALQQAPEEDGDLASALESLRQAALQQAQENSGLRSGLQKLNRSVGQSAVHIGRSHTNSSAGSGETEESDGGEGNNGSGNGAGEGENGSGSGNAGTSAGNGGIGTGTGGSGRGVGHAEPEKIYTRSAAEKGSYDAQLQGTDTQSGQTTVTQQRTMGEAGESVPYDQVYQQYRNDAMRTLESSSVPYGMKELVSEYFSTLEQ